MNEQLLVSLNVVLPMAALLAIGVLLRRKNVVDTVSIQAVDRMNFRVFTPMLLFKNICAADMSVALNARAVGFIVCALAAAFACAMLLPGRVTGRRDQAAALAQGLVRTNFILLGIITGEAIYGAGNAGFIALYGVLIVPAINVLAVVVIELHLTGRARPMKVLRSILKNPMIVAALCGLSLSALRVTLPSFVQSVVDDLAAVATCVGFLSLGVSMDIGKLRENRAVLSFGVVMRLVVMPLAAIPCAVLCGLRGEELCAVMILFASPVGVGTYPTAVAMGADGQLAGQLVYTTTLLSVVTIFVYTFLLGTLGLL